MTREALFAAVLKDGRANGGSPAGSWATIRRAQAGPASMTASTDN